MTSPTPQTASTDLHLLPLDDAGFILPGRASKEISDSLRWEVGRSRVRRLGRGRYAAGSMPGSTRRRIRKRAGQLRVRAERARWEEDAIAVRHRR